MHTQNLFSWRNKKNINFLVEKHALFRAIHRQRHILLDVESLYIIISSTLGKSNAEICVFVKFQAPMIFDDGGQPLNTHVFNRKSYH